MPSMFRSSLGCIAALLLSACSSGAGEGTQGVASVPPGEVVPGEDAGEAPDAEAPADDAATGIVDAGRAEAAPSSDAGDAGADGGAQVNVLTQPDPQSSWDLGDPNVLYPFARAERFPGSLAVAVIYGPKPPATGQSIVVVYEPLARNDGGTEWLPTTFLVTSHPDCAGRKIYPDDTQGGFANATTHGQTVNGFAKRASGYWTLSFSHGLLATTFDLPVADGPAQPVCP